MTFQLLLPDSAEPRAFPCVFPNEIEQFHVEELMIKSLGIDLRVTILHYTTVIRLRNTLHRDYLLARATTRGVTLNQHHNTGPTCVICHDNLTLVLMQHYCAAQLEHRLDLIKEHLLTDTFGDDETCRGCDNICCLVRPECKIDMQAVRRHFNMRWSLEDMVHTVSCSMNRFSSLLTTVEQGIKCELVARDSLNGTFEDIGDTDIFREDDAEKEVVIDVLPDGTIKLAVGGDRSMLALVLSQLAILLSRFVERSDIQE
jgi:hypothetical protein